MDGGPDRSEPRDLAPRVPVPAGYDATLTFFDLYDVHRPALGADHRRFMAKAVSTTVDGAGAALDPAAKELVRLRCARVHDCRICRSIRWAVGPDEYLPESVNDAIDHYEAGDFDESTKVALRLADAYLGAPAELSPMLRTQVWAHYTPGQVVELLLCIMKWSSQKLGVALRVDDPAAADAMMRSSVATGAQGRVVALVKR